MLLTGDIGGTKTSLALYRIETDPQNPIVQETFPSAEYPSLEVLVRKFLQRTGYKPAFGTFGLPGPVVEGRAQVTNLPWIVEEEKLRTALQFRAVRLLNDLEAIANSIPVLGEDDLYVINGGEPVQGGSKGVVAPGTGLGEGFLIWDGKRYLSCSSEGGHATFAPMDERQADLTRFLMKRYGHVSCERVCSGIGIPNIYDFLKESGRASEPGWLAEELESAADRTPVIMRAAAGEGRSCEICEETLRLFVSILGGETGNLALKIMATGGMYLGGGIPPRIIPALESGDFMRDFCSKGRLGTVLEKVPVYVMINPKSALLGSACYGLEMMKEYAG
jgi:glucokinase